MRPWLPIRRPRLGIGFGPQGLSCAEVSESWRRVRTVRRTEQAALEPTVYLPSATGQNFSDLGVAAKTVASLAGPRRDRAVSVTLPDSCGHVGLFEFDTFPAHDQERRALLRFRFHKDLNVTVSDGSLSYQVFPAGSKGASQKLSVLAAAVRPDILAQYVEVCEGADLLAVWLGFGTLQLLEYCAKPLRSAAAAYLVHRTDDSLALIALEYGRPQFLRIRPVRHSAADCTDDIIGTVQFYRAQPGIPGKGRDGPAPMIFINSGASQPVLRDEALAPLGLAVQRGLPLWEERLKSVEPWDVPLPGSGENELAAGWSQPVLAGLLVG